MSDNMEQTTIGWETQYRARNAQPSQKEASVTETARKLAYSEHVARGGSVASYSAARSEDEATFIAGWHAAMRHAQAQHDTVIGASLAEHAEREHRAGSPGLACCYEAGRRDEQAQRAAREALLGEAR